MPHEPAEVAWWEEAAAESAAAPAGLSDSAEVIYTEASRIPVGNEAGVVQHMDRTLFRIANAILEAEDIQVARPRPEAGKEIPISGAALPAGAVAFALAAG